MKSSIAQSLVVAFVLAVTHNATAQSLSNPVLKMGFSSSIADESTNQFETEEIGNTGTFVTDRNGNPSCAYQCNGDYDQYIHVKSGNTLNFDEFAGFTISVWYKSPSLAYADYEGIVSHGDSTFSGEFWHPESYYLIVYDVNKVAAQNAWGPEFATDEEMFAWLNDTSTWHHAVAVYTNQFSLLYVDNELVDTFDMTDYPYEAFGNALYVGRGFAGVIDDVQIFDFAMSDDQVDELYNWDEICSVVASDNSLEIQSWEVYPNPSEGRFTINGNLIESIRVHDLQGRLVFTDQNVNRMNYTLQLEGEPGLYVLTIESAEGVATQMLILE